MSSSLTLSKQQRNDATQLSGAPCTSHSHSSCPAMGPVSPQDTAVPPQSTRIKDKTMQGPLSPLLSVDDTVTLQRGVNPTSPAWTPPPPMSAGLAPSLALKWFLQWSVLCPPIKIMLPGSISLPLPIYFPDSLYHYLKYSMFYLLISLSLSPIRL